MEEVWKSVVGYESFYMVSNLGRVYSWTSNKYMELKPDKKGYLLVRLSHSKDPKTCLVHRLVAQAFIPNPNNYPQVNHLDDDKSNNCVDNLEWCTNKMNNNYGHRLEISIKNSHPVKCHELQKVFRSYHMAERSLNISRQSIRNAIKSGKPTCGYHFIDLS